jgi:hypothetical protein
MSTIKLKRSSSVGQPDPGVLKEGELAYSFLQGPGGDKLYIGTGDGAAAASTPVGGQYYTNLLDHDAGTLTASSAIIVDGDSRIGALNVGDASANLALTGNTITLSATGLTFSGGNIISDGTATITGLPSPTALSPVNQVATKGYVDGVAGGINVSDNTNAGVVEASSTLVVTGTQGVTTLFNATTDVLTIGLQQQLAVDDDVAFGTVTLGSGLNKIKIDDDTIEQVTPKVYHQFDASDTSIVNLSTNLIKINNHGFTDGDAVTYTHGGTGTALDGLNPATTYYVIFSQFDAGNGVGNSFKLSTQVGGSDHDLHSGATGGGDADVLQTATNPVNLFATTDAITIGASKSTVAVQDDLTVGGNTTITGNLQVTGTTTTVDSTVVTIKDPVIELGDDTTDDNLDRGIKFKYNDSGAKHGFFGFRDSDHKFVLIPEATNGVNAQVFTGNAGTLVADVEGNVTGNATTTTGFDSSVLTQNDIDGLGGTTAVAGRQITLTGGVQSGGYTGTGGAWEASPITWDGTGNLTITTKLTQDVDDLLGEYVKDVSVLGTYDSSVPPVFSGSGNGSSIIIGSANGQGGSGQGDHVTVEARIATASNNSAPILDDQNAGFVQNWKNNQGVAEFDSDQFTADNGWVHIATIDGGTYGAP